MCKKREVVDLASFLNKAKLIHNNKYDYSKFKYINAKTSGVIICPIHGETLQKPYEHLKYSGCSKCGDLEMSKKRTYTQEQALNIIKDKVVYDFNYEKFKYTGSIQKSVVVCKQHGEFLISFNNLTRGRNCPKCSKTFSTTGGFAKSDFKAHTTKIPGRIAKLYLLKLYDENESFYKIGITCRELKKRTQSYPYNVKEELIFSHEDSDVIWNLEKSLHVELKEHKYKPRKDFGGMYECFNLNSNVFEKFIELKNKITES